MWFVSLLHHFPGQCFPDGDKLSSTAHFACVFVPIYMQRLIREEWQSLKQREKQEEDCREVARQEKEVTDPFILTNILIHLLLLLLYE